MTTATSGERTLILNLPRFGQGDWWIEMTTFDPSRMYYFGPFLSCKEASDKCPEYILDLASAGAQNISLVIKRCHPAELTKCGER